MADALPDDTGVKRRVNSKTQPTDGVLGPLSKCGRYVQMADAIPGDDGGCDKFSIGGSAEGAPQSSLLEASAKPAAKPMAKRSPMGATPIFCKQEFKHPVHGAAPEVSSGPALGMSRGALRNRFQRSRGILADPRTSAPGARDKSVECIPDDIAKQMMNKDDEEYWMR